jgi:hypothetical protein
MKVAKQTKENIYKKRVLWNFHLKLYCNYKGLAILSILYLCFSVLHPHASIGFEPAMKIAKQTKENIYKKCVLWNFHLNLYCKYKGLAILSFNTCIRSHYFLFSHFVENFFY